MSSKRSKDKRTTRSKKAFKDAFLMLTDQLPLEDITVTSVIELAQYSRATFYTYYKDKDEFI